MEITKLHVENGRLAELIYWRIKEIAEGARGNVVAVRASWFSKDRRVMWHVNQILDSLCKSRGCHKLYIRNGDMVRYVFTVSSLSTVTLEELRQLATQRSTGEERPPARSRRRRKRMVLISVHVPPEFVKAMDSLVKEGRYPHRSAVIREAIRQMLRRYREGEEGGYVF
jgi:hypothetical protein